MKLNFSYRNLILLTNLLLIACAGGTNPNEVVVPTETISLKVTKAPTLSPSPTTEIVSGTITIWHSWEEPYAPALLNTITAFQEEYPNVYFDVLYVPELDLLASLEQAVMDGEGQLF